MNQRLLHKSATVAYDTEVQLPEIRKQKSPDESTLLQSDESRSPQSGPMVSYTVDTDTHRNYRSIMRKQVIFAFIVFFMILLERIFAPNLRSYENGLIYSLQTMLEINYTSSKWYLQPFLFFAGGLNFLLLLAHFFIIIYYLVNPVTCLKIMHVSLNLLVITSVIEILLEEPRPFWDDARIVGSTCKSSYSFPSMDQFGTFFIFIYSRYCLSSHDDDHQTHFGAKFITNILAVLLCAALFIPQILAGLAYPSHLLALAMFCSVAYALVVFFDKDLTKLIEKSSIDFQSAKRYTIFWLIYILGIGALSIFFYHGANFTPKIQWIENYITCLSATGELAEMTKVPSHQLVGPFNSFLKTVVVPMLLGAIFGTAQTFRSFRGVLWYVVPPGKKIIMAILASLCVVPSWWFMQNLDCLGAWTEGGVNLYLTSSIHLCVLYFVLFGVLPKYVFGYLNLTNNGTEDLYFMGAEKDEDETQYQSFNLNGDEENEENDEVVNSGL